MTLSWHRIGKYTLLIGFALCLFGCGNKANEGQEKASDLPNYLDPKKTPSAHWYLSAKDVEKFRVGISKDEILKDIQWRGTFSMAARYQEKEVCAIAYQVFSDPVSEEGGKVVYAIFEDGNFVKFVEWLGWLPTEYIEFIDKKGNHSSRPRQMKIGECTRLLRCKESEPLNMKDLEREVEKQAPAPRQIDPGLTAVFLGLRALGINPIQGATNEDFVLNAKLRDQFNGSRLKIGMSEQEVEAILKADELESGEVQAGTYKIYGSNKSGDISSNIGWPLRFENLLVVYEEGRLSWISSVESYEGWRKSLKELYIDLD